MGADPFAYEFSRTHTAAQILDSYQEGQKVAVAGRIMAIRRMGKASFSHVMDKSGRIQIYVKHDQVGDKAYEIFRLVDIGDFIGIRGQVFKTRTEEITILVENFTLLSKSIRPLPIVKEKIQEDEKIVYDAFKDVEIRYRQRYVDLAVNSDVRRVFETRSRIVSGMRRYLEERGYIEVETPVLQPIYGGAFARPFVTHHNTLERDLFLRIADELYLKRLIVGGFEGVFEIAKDFRNEGMDRDHNPEFTMAELYVSYEDYTFMMDLVEDMVSSLAMDILGTTRIPYGDQEIDLKPPWKRISFFEAIREKTGRDLTNKSEEVLKSEAEALDLSVEEPAIKGKILDAVFSRFVEPELIQPTYILDYPIELSPLAKKHRSIPGLVERFEGYIAAKELCNAFSELNDPLDQRLRFEEQARLRQAGDEEAMVIDEDYLRAMEYGMPPMAGLGIGVDRLVMLLTNMPSIRDVILFPQMRPETHDQNRITDL
jgi:lysyl-tRNA synthetase class 2